MKGSVRDLGVILILSAIFITVSITVASFYFSFKSQVPTIDPNNASGPVLEKADKVITNFVNAIGFIIILLGISAVILAFFIPSHPIFLPITIGVWVLYIVLAVMFSNILWEFINAPAIISTANMFPLVVSIVQYLPHIIGAIGFIIMIVMYSRRGLGE